MVGYFSLCSDLIMDTLEKLTQREQLMEDIDCIIEGFDRDYDSNDDLVLRLCEAVCKNFPA